MRLSRRPKEHELIQLSRSVYYKQVVSIDDDDDGSDDHGGHHGNGLVNNDGNY